jgi:predicted phage tail protein
MAEKEPKQIIGAGGGGGGSSQPVVQQTVVVQQSAPPAVRTPTRQADNLASTAKANILDLISEGEIEGFPSARAYTRGTDNYNLALLKDVFLTDTPVLRSGADVTSLSDSDYNFKGVTVKTRYGTNAQTYISSPGFEAVEDIKSVNTEIKQASPVTRQITDSNVDAVRISLAISRLERGTTEGDVLGTSVSFNFQVQYNGGGFTTVKSDTISGRTADKYERDYYIELDGAFPVDIRVVRTSADSSDTNVSPSFFVAYTEIINQKLRYPNSALAAIRFEAEQFNSIPARSYRIRGIKVKLPDNASVDSDTGRVTYSGTWTGTFGAAQWCKDPAWILYDLLISKRYGFGDHIVEAQLDKFAFFSASQYCNELVNDGLGGEEPRFQCNAHIQNQYEAYKLINDLCSVMRCQPYWSTGSLTITQDKPTDSTYLFNRANVLEPGFSYAGSDLKTRHTVAVVAYLDQETRELNYESVEDRDAIAKYGVVTTQIRAFACTSRGQANRLGRWILFSEQNETEVISFTASIEAGALLRPGAVFDVQDPIRAGVRFGGRIVGSGAKTVSVDDTTGLPSDDATISVLLPDGTLETRDIVSRTGVLITVDENWTTQPQKNSVWIIQTDSLQTQQYRLLTIKEKEGHLYEITGLKYNSSKYDYVESGTALQSRTITNLNSIPAAPTSPKAEEKFYAANDKAKVKLVVSWAAVKGIPQYKVRYRADDDNWEQLTVTKPDTEILDTRAGRYTIEIYSINSLGRQSSDFASLTFNAIGKTAVPARVQNLRFEATSEKEGTLKWDESTELDVKNGGKVYIRHSSLTDGSATWSNSVDLIEAVAGSATSATIPLIEGEVLVKFADDGGRLSTNETSIIIDLPDTLGRLLVEDRREDQDAPPFQGNKTDTFYSEEFDALTLDGTEDLDDVTDVDDLPSFDFMGDITSSGEYAFTDTLDLEGVFSLDLERRFVTRGFYPGDLIDAKTELIDDWDDFDGDTVDKVNAKLLVRRTDDNPIGTPTWTSWQDFANGTFKGRAFQFKAELTSTDTAQNILVDELGYLAQFARRQEQSSAAVASGAGAKAITFGNAFFTGTASLLGTNSNLPSIGITAQNMQSGDYFEVSSVSATGFTVTFKNSSDTAVDRNFNWTAVGYGKAG